VSKLREAELLFSAGRFDTRIGNVFRGRQDALAELAQNFDTMADRVEALVTSQRRLMNDISHELRSPLARLRIAVGLARRFAVSAAEQHLNRIESEAEQLNSLIGQLLALARLNASEQESKVSFDLTAMLQEIAADGRFEARARGCEMVLKTNAQCVITGKPELLRSAIENVVRNAIRYTAPSTAVEIVLELRTGLGCAVISVCDRGPGVPETELERIFEPFYRTNHPGSPDQGTGLGLAITQRATAIHGGKVWASNNPGGGLIVTIQLPAAHTA
jgi:two-component system sensor histidine kinase CpxA